MPFRPAIQSLTGAHSGIYDGTIDWAQNRVFETSGSWITRYGLLSGLEELAVGQVALGIPATYGLALNSAGDVITAGPGAAFNGGIQTLSQTTLTSTSAHAFSGGTYGSSFAAVLVGSQKYSVACGPGGAVGGTHNIMICQDTTQVFSEAWPAYATSGSNHNGALCAGKNGTNKVYLINSPNSGGVTQKVAFTEYTCAASPTKRTLVEFVPADIDAAWTEIYFGGACIDQTDGNLLVFLGGQSGATTRNYLLKVAVSDGSVIWKSAAAGTSIRSPGLMSRSSITQSQFGYVSTDAPPRITIVNTVTGSTISTQTTGLHGLTLVIAGEAYNDTLGCTVGWYSYNYIDTDSPSRLNSTPVNFDGYGVLYIAGRSVTGDDADGWFAVMRALDPLAIGAPLPSPATRITTEDGDEEITEAGDNLITES